MQSLSGVPEIVTNSLLLWDSVSLVSVRVAGVPMAAVLLPILLKALVSFSLWFFILMNISAFARIRRNSVCMFQGPFGRDPQLPTSFSAFIPINTLHRWCGTPTQRSQCAV